MKQLVVGILAHVDAGKTTLSEGILLESGVLKKAGRIDNRDTFLDTETVERQRGITVLSKEAVFSYGDTVFTLLDTPGHVDFSAEAERTLQVLDAAILVVSGSEGVQSHTVTLWQMLENYHVPVFIFINKMDMPHCNPDTILKDLHRRISQRCVDFSMASSNKNYMEEVAALEEDLLTAYLETETLSKKQLASAVSAGLVFPCFFGSALKHQGIDALLSAMVDYIMPPAETTDFGARVYKISHDPKGMRLVHMKITGGSLAVRSIIEEEKVSEIRIYSGNGYESVASVSQGMICAVVGLTKPVVGQGLGICSDGETGEVKPALVYGVHLAEDSNVDLHQVLQYFKVLEQEDPTLSVSWEEEVSEIQIRLMGEVQLEVLQQTMKERFDIEVAFDQGRIEYRETITNIVEGIGHYEPLRHYSEVHLLLEPMPRNSGLVFATDCSEDLLDINWQRLILSHLKEKKHLGVLIGAPITDMKITLIAGAAHKKHTEGGDFREAVYRAVRHGLMKAESLVLEPWYRFRIGVPQEAVGRAMADIQKMGGSFAPPVGKGEIAYITGKAPVRDMRKYPETLRSYTRGKGQIALMYDGYDACHNQDVIIEDTGYEATKDVANTADSVFCQHGSGFVVSWDRVEKYAHLGSILAETPSTKTNTSYGRVSIGEEEIAQVVARAGGAPREKRHKTKKRRDTNEPSITRGEKNGGNRKKGPNTGKEKLYVIDGYNLIFAMVQQEKGSGSEDTSVSMDAAHLEGKRLQLIEMLEDYAGYRDLPVIVVFDAYKVKSHEKTEEKGPLTVVYTEFEETADSYIERFTLENSNRYFIHVVTSDALEQMIIMGHGAMRVSSREFLTQLKMTKEEIRKC